MGAKDDSPQRRLERAVEKGQMQPWKAALAREWLATERGQAGESPSADDLQALLLDPQVRARLSETNGPWDVLVAQAQSMQSQNNVGDALTALGDVYDTES